MYGCILQEDCPLGFCIHIKGVAGLDVEKMTGVIWLVNNKMLTVVEDIALEDIGDFRPPIYMNLKASLKTFRGTNNHEFNQVFNVKEVRSQTHQTR